MTSVDINSPGLSPSTPVSAPPISNKSRKMTSVERDALIQKVIKVAIPILIGVAIITACGAMGPAGWALGGAIVGGIVIAGIAYMVSNNTFGLKDLLKKISESTADIFTQSKNGAKGVQNTLGANAADAVNVLEGQKRNIVQVASPKEIFSTEFTAVMKWHNEIKQQFEGDPTLTERPVQGPEDHVFYTCEKKDAAEGIVTYLYKNEQNKVVYQLNEFADGAINGARNQDFVDRLDLVFDSVKYFVNQQENFPENEKPELSRVLDTMKNTAMEKIEVLDRVETLSGDDKDVNEKFEEIYENAKGIIKESFVAVSLALSEKFPDVDLVKIESEYVKSMGRPTIINTFSVPGSDKKLINIHKPLLDQTLPSTVRYERGLSNALHNLSGYVEGEEVVITSTTFRNSSIPPIAVENKYDRLEGSIHNAGQVVDKIIHTSLGSLGAIPESSESEPIELNWNNMVLLTPVTGDSLMNRNKEGVWIGQSESDMLQESLRAVMSYAGQTTKVTLNGQEVYVRMNVSAMNFGCNIAAMDSRHVKGAVSTMVAIAPHPTLQRDLNGQGFMEFELQTDDYLHRQIKELGDDALSAEFNEYCKLKNHMINRKFLELKNEYQARLVTLNANLKSLVIERNVETNEEEKRSIEKKIDKTLSKIDGIEKEIRKESLKFFSEKQAIYKKNEAKIQEMSDQIYVKLKENGHNDVAEVLSNQLKFAKSLINREYRDPKTLLNAQSIYIDTMSLMNSPVSFYCKSGEDRTGIVGLRVDALNFQRITGLELDSIINRLIDTSPGTDTNAANAPGSRGFQITDLIVPDAKKRQIWQQKMISLLAKRCTVKKSEIVKLSLPSQQQSVIEEIFEDDEITS